MSEANQIRINELARDLEVRAQAIIDYLPEAGVNDTKTHSSSIDVAVAVKVRQHFRELAEAESAAERKAAADKLAKEALAKGGRLKPSAAQVGAIERTYPDAIDEAPGSKHKFEVIGKTLDRAISDAWTTIVEVSKNKIIPSVKDAAAKGVTATKRLIDGRSHDTATADKLSAAEREIERLRSDRDKFFGSPDIASESQKTSWDESPENRGLREIAQDLEPKRHYLDLPPSDKKIIWQCHQEKLKEAVEPKALTILHEDARSKKEGKEFQSKARENKSVSTHPSKREREIKKLRSQYARSCQKFRFRDEALERLSGYDDSIRGIFENQFYRMDHDNLYYKDAIEDTNPTVYEIKAGYDYRIYCRPDGVAKHIILLVGHKNKQNADCKLLRGSLNSTEGQT